MHFMNNFEPCPHVFEHFHGRIRDLKLPMAVKALVELKVSF
jgi:hypothetical protein